MLIRGGGRPGVPADRRDDEAVQLGQLVELLVVVEVLEGHPRAERWRFS